MPRRKAAVKREVLPDPLYRSELVARFINVIMRRGKKSIAEKILYQALQVLTERIKKESKADDSDKAKSGSKGKKQDSSPKQHAQSAGEQDESLELLQKALSNIAPTVEVKSRRVGGATYQVPVEVTTDRGVALAMRWIVAVAKERSEKMMALKLAAELLAACNGQGAAIKKRDDMHKMAKANQAFAHYRW